MATTTISILTEAHQRLCQLRRHPKESFSTVILRETADPLQTCGEVLEHFERAGVPEADPKLRQAMLAGRGRRSPRRL